MPYQRSVLTVVVWLPYSHPHVGGSGVLFSPLQVFPSQRGKQRERKKGRKKKKGRTERRQRERKKGRIERRQRKNRH